VYQKYVTAIELSIYDVLGHPRS